MPRAPHIRHRPLDPSPHCLPPRRQAITFSAISLAWNAILSFLSNRPTAVDADATAETPEGAERMRRRGLVRTRSGRWLPAHQPPMGILDNDPEPAPPKPALSDQRLLGFLLGPGLM